MPDNASSRARAKPRPGGHKRRRPDQAGNGGGDGGEANGPGYGGPANGLYARFTATSQPDPAAIGAGQAAAKTARELARAHVPAAVALWATVVADADAPPMARIVAADKLVERAEGKPEQTTNLNVSAATPEQRAARIAALEKKLGRAGPVMIEGKAEE